MPMAPAYARKLIANGKANLWPHYAFTVVQLQQVIEAPVVRPVVVGIVVHQRTAEIIIIAEGEREVFPLLSILVDLHTDLPRRIRRRAAHRRRRRGRGRYRAPQRHGIPFKLRRPSVQRSRPRVSRHQPTPVRRAGRSYLPTTIRWRAEAIERVINALRALVPISHIILLPAEQSRELAFETPSAALRHEQLVQAYGAVTADGRRLAKCAYCGTTIGPIEVDHLLPRSRGGTDAWRNTILACADCNRRKGDRTPDEAGMHLRVQLIPAPPTSQWRPSHQTRLRRLLIRNLQAAGLAVDVWPSNIVHPEPPFAQGTSAALERFLEDRTFDAPQFIARPIARPRKQRYTARHYPSNTLIRKPYERVRGVVRRRVRINRGLAIEFDTHGTESQVVGGDQPIPKATQAFISLGTLCEGRRNDQSVIGIVSAVHSSGRLTLSVPDRIMPRGVSWRRVIIVPSMYLRILSKDRVIFLASPF